MERSAPTYSTGTVSGMIGTTQVAGMGTGWVVSDQAGNDTYRIAQYDEFLIAGQGPILIDSIEDDQHLTLVEPLPFGIAQGTPYKIIQRTVSASQDVVGSIQKLLLIGTADRPLVSEYFDDGATGRVQFAFSGGQFKISIGDSGADGSPAKPFRASISLNPADGSVSIDSLSGGGNAGQQSGTFNKIWYLTGKPSDSIGQNGDLSIDFISGFVIYTKQAGHWSSGLDVLSQVAAAAVSASAAAASAQAAADALANIQSQLTSATQTAVNSVTQNVTTALQLATLEAQGLVAQLRGRVFDFNLAIDPQTQTYAGGQDWNANV